MVSDPHHRREGYRIFAMLVGLLCVLIPCTGAWSQGKGLKAADTRQRSAAQGLYVDVQQGRLSVDLQEADLGEVLAQVGQQAGIRMVSGPSAGKKVSAHFAGLELEEGLRRLLRLASLSHIFLYAHGPAGRVTISEVRVLGESKEAPPRQPTVAEPGPQENEQNTDAPVRKPPRQARTRSARGVGSVESEVPEVVQEVGESAEESTSDPGQGQSSDATRRFTEIFKLGSQMGRKPPDGQEASPDEPKQQSGEPSGAGGGMLNRQ
jgi:hypothetical protein